MPVMASPSVDVAAEEIDYAALQSPVTLDRHNSTETFVPPSLQPSSSAYELPEHDTRPSLASPSSLPSHHEEDKGDEFPAPYHKTHGTALDKVGLALAIDPKHHLSNAEQKEQEALATSLSIHPTPVHPTNGHTSVQQHKPDESEKSEHGALDLTTISTEILATDPRVGLTAELAAQRLVEYGFNEIQEHRPSRLLKFLSYFTGSIAYLIEAAAILSGALQDWTDFGIITALLFVNAFIGFMEESKAESAVEALKSTLALRCRVMRDGKMSEMEARHIVPGDIISLRTGDVISADAVVLPRVKKNSIYNGLPSDPNVPHERFADGHTADDDDDQPVELSADQAALTGESLPTMKHPRDLLYSSSIVKTGQALALVIKTGEKTFVGRAGYNTAIPCTSTHLCSSNALISAPITAASVRVVCSQPYRHHNRRWPLPEGHTEDWKLPSGHYNRDGGHHPHRRHCWTAPQVHFTATELSGHLYRFYPCRPAYCAIGDDGGWSEAAGGQAGYRQEADRGGRDGWNRYSVLGQGQPYRIELSHSHLPHS